MKITTSLLLAFLLANNCIAQFQSGDYIITLADGGKALDADGPGMNTNGGIVHLWDNNGGTTQVWTIKPVTGNAYSIVLTATGKALDADGPGMYKDGGVVHLWDKRNDGFKTQTWKINPTGNNSYTVVLADGGKALDAGINSMHANDGLVHLWSYNGNKTQKWMFTKVIPIANGQTVISALFTLSHQDNALWEMANNDQLGIIGNDFRGPEHIGTASFERDFKANTWWAKVLDGISLGQLEQLDNLNIWVPQHIEEPPYKRTLSGRLSNSIPEEEPNPHIADEEEILTDFDLNIDINPDPKYKYLISQARVREYTKLMSAEYKGTAHKFGQKDCNGVGDLLDFSERVEAEISIDENRAAASNQKMLGLLTHIPNQPVCVYGPWIFDKGHCCHPEIHPAEEIWWRESNGNARTYFCNVFCDASERFWWRDQMDDGIKLKPWGAPPTKGLFAIAFEINLGRLNGLNLQQTKKFEASYFDHYNITEYPGADKTYSLIYQNNTLVSFIPHWDVYKVSFEKVGLKPGTTNVVRGFLVIETSVGTYTQVTNKIPGTTITINIPSGTSPEQVDQKYERQVFKKEKGHYMFSISETTSGGRRPSPNSRE